MKSATPSTPELSVAPSQPMPVESQSLTPATSGGISIEQAFQAAATKALDKESLEVMKQLLAMDAERRFSAAFVALQSDLPQITATSVIPNRGKYEKFEDILDVVQPFLTKHGFTVSFSMDFKENRIVETCHLTHGGYTRSNSFAVRSGKADSDTQADCKAATTAKRNAFCNALNIVIRQDVLNNENDASIEGDPYAKVTQEQADELERRVKETNSNLNSFMRLAGAASFSNILAKDYDMLDRLLREKETKGR
jgi:hypothetical protein